MAIPAKSLKSITFKIEGLKELFATLNNLDKKAKRRIQRKALTAAGTHVVKALKAAAPKDTGWLKRSLAKKVITRKGNALVIVGPQSLTTRRRIGKKRVSVIEKTSFGKRLQKANLNVNPAKYAHFTEFGTSRGVKEQKWFRNTVARIRPQVFGVIEAIVKRELESEATRGKQRA